MKLFEHVAVVGSSEASDPQVLRSVLEEFGLRVHLYRLYQKRNVEDFFAGRGLPKECRYTVLCAHGHGPDDDPKIRLEVVDQKDGDPDAVEGWERRPFDLSRGNVPGLVTAPRGVLVAGGCGAGREPLARAFLEAGYDGYVGATEDYVDGDSALLFTIGFFYHLLADERDYAPRTFTDREAAERARRWTVSSNSARGSTATGDRKTWRPTGSTGPGPSFSRCRCHREKQ
jgi:hypothetical protein